MMVLLAAMVAKRVSCSALPLWRPLSLGPLPLSLFAGASSQALSVSAHSTRHMLGFPPTLASSSGTLAAPVHRVSQLHSGASLLLAGDSNIWFPFFQLGRSRQADAPLLPIVQEILQSRSLVFRNPPDLPTHRCGAALDIILSSPSLSTPITVHSGLNCCPLAPLCCPLLSSDHMLCSCRLDIPEAPLSPSSAHSPLLRVHDWSTVVAACHHSLSA